MLPFSLLDLILFFALGILFLTVGWLSRAGRDLAPNSPKAFLARMEARASSRGTELISPARAEGIWAPWAALRRESATHERPRAAPRSQPASHDSPRAAPATPPAAPEPRRPIAVLAGDSITRGSVSASYADMLAARLPDWDFVNAGINGELAYNLSERLDEIIALAPEAVTVLIGTNDVIATFGLRAALGYMAVKRLPEAPSPYFYRENLVGIVRRLKRETKARIALFSIPPIGEELGHYAFLRTEEYAAIISGIAKEEGVEYLPLRERMCAYLESMPPGQVRPLPFSRFGAAQLGTLRHQHYLGKSLDEVSAANRFHLLVDGIHLNSHGASIAADLAEAFLRKA